MISKETATTMTSPVPEGTRIICIHCHGHFQNIDKPEFDAENQAIFTCAKCGAKSVRVLDITTQNQSEETMFTKPQTIEERTEIARLAEELRKKAEQAEAENIFHCLEGKIFPESEEYRDNKGKLSTELLAHWIHINLNFKTDMDTDTLYFYNGKAWIPNAEPYLRKIVNYCLNEETKQALYQNIEFNLKTHSYDKIKLGTNLSCLNGILNSETHEFKDFTPEEMTLYQIDTTYDPDAPVPLEWLDFVNSIVEPEDIATLQEWSGYMLLPDYRYHKVLWCIGEGRNGKGVWTRTMQEILGVQNTSRIGINEFDGKHSFSMANLYGKLANFSSEPSIQDELNTELLKFATGQDTLDAEIKFAQKRLSFTNIAKISVFANFFPNCTDTSKGWLERILFLRFPFEFTGSKAIPNLEQRWLNDPKKRSGVLNWMLEGLQHLLKQGGFTYGKSHDEMINNYLRESDTISAFIRECGLKDKENTCTRPEATFAYNAYCDFYGLEAENGVKLSARLKKERFVKDKSRHPTPTTNERIWQGISFKIMRELDPPKKDTPDTKDTGLLFQSNILVDNIVTEASTVSLVSSVSEQEVCYKRCGNFDRKGMCPEYGDINQMAVKPLDCKGFALLRDNKIS